MEMKSYYEQHSELLAIAGRLSKAIAGKLADIGPAKAAFDIVLELAAKLSTHLAAEDKFLYPKMKTVAGDAGSVASRLEIEMGHVKTAFGDYRKKWGTVNAIQANGAAFCSDTSGLIAALGKRIDVENRQLYPLAAKI